MTILQTPVKVSEIYRVTPGHQGQLVLLIVLDFITGLEQLVILFQGIDTTFQLFHLFNHGNPETKQQLKLLQAFFDEVHQ